MEGRLGRGLTCPAGLRLPALALCLLLLWGCGGASKLSVNLPPDSEQPATLFTPDSRIKAVVPPAAVADTLRLLIVNTSEMDYAVPGPADRSLVMSVDISAQLVPQNTDSAAGGDGSDGAADGGSNTDGGAAAPEPEPKLAKALEMHFMLQPALAPGLSIPLYLFNPVSQRYEESSLSGLTSDDGTELVFSADDFGRYAFFSLKQDELPPPAPDGLRLLAASTQVRRLSWNSVAGVAGYNLYRALDSGPGGAEPSFSKLNAALLTERDYSDELSAPGAYLYRVSSVWPENAGGQSLESLPSAELASPAVPFDVLFEFGNESGSGLHRPGGLAMDSAGGRLFVADPYAGDVFVYDLAGKQMGSFFRYGQTEALSPSAVAYDTDLGRLYVADSGLHAVYLLHAGMNRQTSLPYALSGTFGQEGSGPGEFASPCALALWQGQVLVADRGLDKLQQFTPLGVYLRTLAQAGDQEGQLLDPLALLAQDSGGLLIADFGNLRLSGFGDDLAPASPIEIDPLLGGPLSPAGLAEDFRGQIYVSDPPGRRVRVLDSAGAELFSFGSQGSLIVEFGAGGPGALALDRRTGYLYVCDPDNGRILVFSS